MAPRVESRFRAPLLPRRAPREPESVRTGVRCHEPVSASDAARYSAPEGRGLPAGERPVRKQHITFLRVLILGVALLAGYLEWRHRHPAASYAGNCDSADPKALSVLFVGNSLTFYNDLPALFCALALRAGPARIRSVTAPGWSLHDHLDAGDAERAIASERWDFVVLQEQGARPTFAPKDFEVSVRQLAAIAAAHGARPTIYETWQLLDIRQDARALHEEFAAVSRETGFLLVPVGSAWRDARTKHPTLEFLAPDQHHPSALGSAFAAQVFFASLLDRSPEGLPGIAGLDAETSLDLQRIAWSNVNSSRTPGAL